MAENMENRVFSGYYKGGHVQGIAVDRKRGYLYYSFTTLLVKTDLEGRAVGSVNNLAGHLGCITYDAETDMLYGSLELKHDVIGRDIVGQTGREIAAEDAFYLVQFDTLKIDRMDMDAECDGVMRAVYLQDVVRDYLGSDPVSGKPHCYGCSGIDGVALGPVFGEMPGSTPRLMVAYGIYADTDRQDNDHQVLLQFDRAVFEEYGRPLDQANPHHSGPDGCEARYFFFTGNTRYGIQNLEYDSFSRSWLVAVYKGQKACYRNFSLFAIDGTVKPRLQTLTGRGQEQGLVLSSAKFGEKEENAPVWGSFFKYGSTGMASLGDGTFLFSESGHDSEKQMFYTFVQKYAINPEKAQLFEIL